MKYPSRNIQHALFLKLARLQGKQKSEGGYSLVVTVAMLLILSTLLISAAVVSKVNSASTTASSKSNSGFFGAEAGLNIRAKEIRNKFEGFNRPAGVSPSSWNDCADGSSTNDGSGDFQCGVVNFQGQDVLTYVEEDAANPSSIIVPNGEKFEGLSAQEYRYDLVSIAKDSQDLPTAMLEMSFKSRVVPLFQFAVFYENDADFTVPPNMTLNGRVHSNADLYLNTAWNQYTLRINGQVTTGGTLYRGDKADRGSQQCRGTVVIPTLGGTDQNLNCTSTTSIQAYNNGTTTPSDISTWDGAIKTDIPKLEVPQPDFLDPAPGSLYWDSADLRVVLDVSGGAGNYEIQIRDQDGSVNTSLTSKLNNSCSVLEDTTLTSAATATDFDGLALADTSEFAGDEQEIFLSINGDSHNKVLKAVNGGTIDISHQLGATAPVGSTVRRAVVSSSDTFFNYREKHGATGGTQGQEITMLNVDMQALLDCVHEEELMKFAGGTLTKPINEDSDGGLVWFFTVLDGSTKPDLTGSTSQVGSTYGIRIFNGEHLISTDSTAPMVKGLTVVSDEAVYVRGDYNLNDDDPTTTGITEEWRPAAVMSDSVNVLSNAWNLDDSNGRSYNSSGLPSTIIYYNDGAKRRSAVETTVNAAFLSGTEITGGANGAATQNNNINSGGVNNFPRFHEHWGDTNVSAGGQDCDAVYGTTQTRHCFNYRGSFVSLNEPRRVNSDFCGSYNAGNCNIYTPPVRNWDYDTRFNDAANLPPLTPRAVYLRQELFRRDFDRTSNQKTNLFAAASNIPSIQPNFSL